MRKWVELGLCGAGVGPQQEKVWGCQATLVVQVSREELLDQQEPFLLGQDRLIRIYRDMDVT